MLLNILQCVGQPLKTKNCPSQNVKSAKVEKSSVRKVKAYGVDNQYLTNKDLKRTGKETTCEFLANQLTGTFILSFTV